MKQSDFFEKLNRELENAVPPMSERLKDEPICTHKDEPVRTQAEADTAERAKKAPVSAGTTPSPAGGNRKRKRARLWGAVGAVAAAVLIVCSAVLGALSTRPVSPRYACMYIDINPSLALTLDENYRVKKAVSRNADADTFLNDEAFAASLVGVSAEEAALLVAERAAQTGYIRLEDTGSEDAYNQMNVTLLASAEAPAEQAQAIEADLTEYFREKGLYVYVKAEAQADAETESLVKDYEARPAAWYSLAAAEADFEELKTLAENAVYDYAAYLLTDALAKYDLLGAIGDLNAQIEADPDNKGGALFGNYWTVDENLNGNVRALCDKMKPLLEKLYLLYGIDCRERGGLQGAVSYQKYIAVSAYRATISDDALEALRALDKAGINDSTFGGIENLPLRVEYYKLISNKLFSDVAANILDGLSTTAEKLTEDISALIDSRAKELYEKYSALFALPRPAVTESDYAEFLERIGKA